MDAEQRAHRDAELRGRRPAQLEWLTTVTPAVTVYLSETVRHALPDQRFPTPCDNLAAGLIILGFAFGCSLLDIGIAARLRAQAVAHNRELATLSAVIAERERLGRELQHGLAQLVDCTLVRLCTVADPLAARRAAEAKLARLRAVAEDLHADIRESSAALRAALSRACPPGDLGRLPRGVRGAARYPGRLVRRRGRRRTVATGGYQQPQIVQEALAHVRKRAYASRAGRAKARPEPGWLTPTVGDDGQGFDPVGAGEQAALGLTTPRERAEGPGGWAAVESAPARHPRRGHPPPRAAGHRPLSAKTRC